MNTVVGWTGLSYAIDDWRAQTEGPPSLVVHCCPDPARQLLGALAEHIELHAWRLYYTTHPVDLGVAPDLDAFAAVDQISVCGLGVVDAALHG